jgi:hypothetical protein
MVSEPRSLGPRRDVSLGSQNVEISHQGSIIVSLGVPSCVCGGLAHILSTN